MWNEIWQTNDNGESYNSNENENMCENNEEITKMKN